MRVANVGAKPQNSELVVNPTTAIIRRFCARTLTLASR